MSHIHINIGSNKGDRAALIERAVALIAKAVDADNRCEIYLSPIVESEPWGYESSHSFLNLAMMIVTPDKCEDVFGLFDKLQAVEQEICSESHRTADGGYADRFIDIDLIAVDDMVVENQKLTLPHPRMMERPFVIEPLRQLDPEWRHPLELE